MSSVEFGTEAYLDTARRRISVRRHVRLVDYPMHEGCNARAWVHASGVAEIGTAGLMAVPATRRVGGWAAAALLVAFLPAHLHTYRVVPRRALPMTVAAVRLPLQAPLVRIALRVARER